MKWLFIFTALLAGCHSNSVRQQEVIVADSTELPTTVTTLSESDSVFQLTKDSTDYYFEPEESTVTGILRTELFYGPPGYGESPARDKKEEIYILYADRLFNVQQKEDTEDETGINVPTNNIDKVQLVLANGVSLRPLPNKQVMVTGSFFGSHTGHHRTAVLMTVKKAEEVLK